MTLRDALTSALAGPLVNARARSAGVAPCAPTPGRSRIAFGSSRRASPTARGWVAPDDRAHAREAALADELLAELVHEPRHVLPERPSVREDQVLDVGAAFVRGLDDAEDPGAVTPARGEEGLERVASEVRVHGQRVGEGGALPVRLEVRRGVGARGRPDVGALAVGEHDQPGRAGVGADLFERADPVGAERLEERELRLDRRRRAARPRR